MLALTRREGEEIVIGDPRKPLGVIRVVEIHGDKVRLSFDFPRDTQINRKELAELKAKHNEGQGGSAGPPSVSPPAAPAATNGKPPIAPAPPGPSNGPTTA